MGKRYQQLTRPLVRGGDSLREATWDEALDRAAAGFTAQLCCTLGITEHHNGTENVLSLTNLSLLTGHIGCWGSGLAPVRGQNKVQGGGDMGALPDGLPGFKDAADDEKSARFKRVYGTEIPAEPEPAVRLPPRHNRPAGPIRL